MTDVVLLALLCAAAFFTSALLWHLLVQPEVLLSSWDDAALSEGHAADPYPKALRWLRVGLGAVVFLTGFLTGLALAFLAATA